MYKNKILLLIMAFTLFPVLTIGCSIEQKNDEVEQNEEATIVDDVSYETTTSTEIEEETSIDITSIYRFSDGMQWVTSGSDNNIGNYICINEEGNAIFAINDPDVSSISAFSEGCSFIVTDESVYQIDLSGNVIKSYSLSDTVKYRTFSEGQIWIEEYDSNFDNANYTYTLYD